MKPDLVDLIQNAREKRADKFRTQFAIFLICLVISTFLWFLVKLSKDYYYTIGYRLTFTQIPENLRLVKCSENTLVLKMKVQGFDLVSERYIIPNDQVADVSLRNIKVKPDGRFLSGYLMTQSIGKEIAIQANISKEIVSVSPDTLFFNFERIPLQKISTPGNSKQPDDANVKVTDSVFIHDSLLKVKTIPDIKKRS